MMSLLCYSTCMFSNLGSMLSQYLITQHEFVPSLGKLNVVSIVLLNMNVSQLMGYIILVMLLSINVFPQKQDVVPYCSKGL
jgi:hypothetical protein